MLTPSVTKTIYDIFSNTPDQNDRLNLLSFELKEKLNFDVNSHTEIIDPILNEIVKLEFNCNFIAEFETSGNNSTGIKGSEVFACLEPIQHNQKLIVLIMSLSQIIGRKTAFHIRAIRHELSANARRNGTIEKYIEKHIDEFSLYKGNLLSDVKNVFTKKNTEGAFNEHNYGYLLIESYDGQDSGHNCNIYTGGRVNKVIMW
ncbi:MAG: hypothetical protein IJY09_08785 [Lachnospiraceae bacterium]|nr:hypothetical protein [Lachnospiraceae bacterium]